MKKAFLLFLLSLAVSLSAFAEDRHQSFLSYDDGGTVVRSGDDGREIDAHRNLPIYPGDEIITARRGRAEVRLSDGNIIGIDRTTALKVRSVLDAYEGDANETVAELRYGKVAVYRTDIGRDHVRLDTDNASYVAEREGVYSVETDSNGRDRVMVFDGSIEVRTRTRTTRLRSGESAQIDDRGVYDLAGDQSTSADDFERWFLKRAERFERFQSRYVDRRLGYYADDLDDYGRWVFVTGIGWSWRPYVAAGWRPYYNGYWHHGRGGYLTWVSYDPWAWGPYHYGRWAFDPGFGWVWVPGYGYSPAWVYWTYGAGYVGWAPSGYWDCYRPYYNWAYQPYVRSSYGFGFYGRVRVNEFDLRPWTFVDSTGLISNRIDRAALTTDAVKARMSRAKDGYAPITGGATRFTREEMRDPAEAIRRRSIDPRYLGRETGAQPADVTPFVRRDANVGGAVRDRIVSSRGGSGTPSAGSTAPSSGITRGGFGGGTTTPSNGGSFEGRRSGGGEGRINRGSRGDEPSRSVGGGDRGTVSRDPDTSTGTSRGDWRDRATDRLNRGGADRPTEQVAPSAPRSSEDGAERTPRTDSWRNRVRNGSGDDAPRATSPSSGETRDSGSSTDVPRRVIDGIGGARVVPRGGDNGSSTRDRGTRDSSGDRAPRSGSWNRGDSGSRDNGSSRSSGGSSAGSSGGGSRQSAPPPPPPRNDGGGRSNGGSREDGGRIKRDQ